MNSSSNSSNSVVVDYDQSVTVRSLLRASGLAHFMETPGITEIAINRPGEIATESSTGWQRHDAPACTLDMCRKLANALAIFNKTHISPADPIKPVRFPDGQRGQLAVPPACEPNTVSLTIRLPNPVRLGWEDYSRSGLLDGFHDMASRAESVSTLVSQVQLQDARDVATHTSVPANVTLASFVHEMLAAKAQRDLKRFFELAIEHKLNIVLVGGTGSGKTTLMKMLADMVPRDLRVATIEDTHELPLPHHWNRVHLFYGDTLPAKEVVKSTLRMKFDRVYLAELRGDETWDYLTLLNTGHQGGMTTVHANDCISAFSRIATLIKQSAVGQTLDWNYLLREVKMTVDVVLFLERKRLTQLYYDPVEKWKLQRGLA
ncbi:P-type DNA transfer ATPase VirB11 [Cupriavidus sp. CP313]